MIRVSIFLITVALIAGIVGCTPPPTPIPIGDWYDLDAIRDNLGDNYVLVNDLDSTTAGYEELASPTANQGKGWEPIGTIGEWGDRLTGTLYGQGYEIRDLFINRPGDYEVGLFGAVGQEGVVENIGVVNVVVTGHKWVGGIVGHNEGTVSNSYSSGIVTSDNYDVGGLVGYNYGTVSNSYSSANVTGEYSVGGLVGRNEYGWGGVEGTVSNSYFTGSVTSYESYAGGLVGWNRNEGTVSNSYSSGKVTGNSGVGGLVGWNEEGTVSNSFWDTETSGQAASDGGTDKTTAQMQDITTFSGATWNITTVASSSTRDTGYIWNIVDDVTYPFLSWQP
jgi:hypothetical protein